MRLGILAIALFVAGCGKPPESPKPPPLKIMPLIERRILLNGSSTFIRGLWAPARYSSPLRFDWVWMKEDQEVAPTSFGVKRWDRAGRRRRWVEVTFNGVPCWIVGDVDERGDLEWDWEDQVSHWIDPKPERLESPPISIK